MVVTWFCSEFLISSSNFPFPSSLSSRAAAYLYAPAHACSCDCVYYTSPHTLLLAKFALLSSGLAHAHISPMVVTNEIVGGCDVVQQRSALISVVPIPLYMRIVLLPSLKSPLPSSYHTTPHPSKVATPL